jgi:hypothetical protein
MWLPGYTWPLVDRHDCLVTDSETDDDYGERLRLAEEAFGVLVRPGDTG